MPSRLVPNETARRGFARRRLMELLWEKRGVRNAVEIDLRPLWKSFTNAHPDIPVEIYSFNDLYMAPGIGQLGFPNPPTSPFEPYIRPPKIDASQLQSYLDALEAFVSKRLRVTTKGRAPTWAMSDIHDRVLGRDLATDPVTPWTKLADFWDASTPLQQTTIQLTLDVTPGRAVLICVDESDNDLLHVEVLTPGDRAGGNIPDAYLFFSDWNALEEAAIQVIRESALPKIKNSQTYSLPQRNERSELEMIDSIALVADWCYENSVISPRTKDRLAKSTLLVLGIDKPPSPRKNPSQNRIRSFRERARKRGTVDSGHEA